MYNQQRDKIDGLIQHGYEFSFSQYIERAIELYRKGFWYLVVFALLMLVIVFMVQMIPVIGSVAVTFILGPCLNAGFYLGYDYLKRDELNDFSKFLEGFQYWKELAVMTLFQLIIVMIILVPVSVLSVGWEGLNSIMLSEFEFSASSRPGLLLFALLPIIYLGVSWAWAPLLIIFYDYSSWEALETSRRLITKRWGIFFLFYIVTGFISIIGFIGLIVGIIFTLPFLYAAQYAAFMDITTSGSDEVTIADEDEFVDNPEE